MIKLSEFSLVRKLFQTTALENIKTHILCSINSFPENYVNCYIIWGKNGRYRQVIDDNDTTHAHCMLDIQVQSHALRI